MNPLSVLVLVVAALFLAMVVVAVRSDRRSSRRAASGEWHSDSHRSPSGSDQYGPQGGLPHPGSPNP